MEIKDFKTYATFDTRRKNMKIALPIQKTGNGQLIASSFGRTAQFMIFDSVCEQSTLIENTAMGLQGGAGIRAAQILIDRKIDALITPQCGENAEVLLRKANISLYRSNGNIIAENIDLLLQNKLTPLDDIHPGFHHSR
jgi:predicted Fe-Mo cluster-binding NifX family protein